MKRTRTMMRRRKRSKRRRMRERRRRRENEGWWEEGGGKKKNDEEEMDGNFNMNLRTDQDISWKCLIDRNGGGYPGYIERGNDIGWSKRSFDWWPMCKKK